MGDTGRKLGGRGVSNYYFQNPIWRAYSRKGTVDDKGNEGEKLQSVTCPKQKMSNPRKTVLQWFFDTYTSFAPSPSSIFHDFPILHSIPPSRHKIDAIIRRQKGVPDEDAPDDAESTRFWATVGGKFEDKEKMSVNMTSTTGVKSTPDAVESIMATGENSNGPLALTDGSGTPRSTPTLEEFVGVINSTTAPKAKAKAKGKAKAKAAANPQLPKTPSEQRDASRALVLISANFSLYPFSTWSRVICKRFYISLHRGFGGEKNKVSNWRRSSQLAQLVWNFHQTIAYATSSMRLRMSLKTSSNSFGAANL